MTRSLQHLSGPSTLPLVTIPTSDLQISILSPDPLMNSKAGKRGGGGRIREHYYGYFQDFGGNSLDVKPVKCTLAVVSCSGYLPVASAGLTTIIAGPSDEDLCEESYWNVATTDRWSYSLLMALQVFSHIISPTVKTKNYPPAPCPLPTPCEGTRESAAFKVINFTRQRC